MQMLAKQMQKSLHNLIYNPVFSEFMQGQRFYVLLRNDIGERLSKKKSKNLDKT